jgi:small multidrug resistance family-3 protein
MHRGGSPWLLPIGAAALGCFAFLLTLHPAASGRIYAAYGGVYVATALVWLKIVDGEALSSRDWIGAGLSLLGMAVIVSKWR